MSVFGAKCDRCGRFMRCGSGSSWSLIYDFVGHGLDREVTRCAPCTEVAGPPNSNATPANGDMSPYRGVVA